MTQENAFWTKEVADILQIAESTLRKWCIQLEKNDYTFTKGTNGSRAFVERDLANLRRLKDLIQSKGMTVESAANLVTSMDHSEGRTRGVPETNVLSHTDSALLTDILKRQERLETLNKQLLEKLDEQQQFISKTLADRDQKMNFAIQEIRKNQQLLAASAEQQKKKKGFFGRLFSSE